MRVPAALLIASIAAAAGCTSLASRDRTRDRDRDRPAVGGGGGDRPWWLDGESTARDKSKPLPADLAKTDREGIIAGTLVDGREGKPLRGVTRVQVRVAEEAAPTAGKGLGFDTDGDGYFFASGLTPGQTYILTVVREVDGRKIAGEAQVKPPASTIRLVVSEDLVSSSTPPIPPPPSMGPFEKSPPIPGIDPPMPPLPKENIAGTPTLPPIAAIRPPPAAAPPANEPPEVRRPAGPRMPNFLVSDTAGNDWEFKSARGQVVLVEFWSTSCIPCQTAMPVLKRLQSDYGNGGGLEIAAVACEPEAPLEDRARDVDEVARRKQLTYPVYVERRPGDMQRLFEVRWVPTLVLLDRDGQVLWRGGATANELAQLEAEIKSRLRR